MQTIEIAAQFLEMVTGRHTQVLIGRRVVDHLEFAEQPAFEVGWNVPGVDILHKVGPQPFVPKTDDHSCLRFRVNVPLYGSFCKRGEITVYALPEFLMKVTDLNFAIALSRLMQGNERLI
jgi:hypothetical protein